MITKEQKIISKLEEHLPFKVYSEHIIWVKLREAFPQVGIKKDTLFVVYNLHDMRDEGGIGCAIRPIAINEGDDEIAFVCSITQLKLIPSQPLYTELQKYKLDRIKKLEMQNRGMRSFIISK